MLLHWPKFIGHFWSLAIEEQFYLAIPVIALLTPSRHLRTVCAAIVVFGVGMLFWLDSLGLARITVHTNSFVNFGMIAFGGVCRLSIRGDGSGMRNGSSSWTALAILMTYFGFNYIGARFDLPQVLMHLTPVLAGFGLVALALNQQSRVVSWLEWAPLAWFGRITYGFYIYHNLVSLNTIVPLLNELGFDVPFPQRGAAVISFFISLGVAWLSYRYIEQPLIKGGRTKSKGAGAPAVVQGAGHVAGPAALATGKDAL